MRATKFVWPLMIACVGLPGVRPAAAQVTGRLVEPPEFALDQWTTQSGLPQNSVTAIAQTPDGYLWVGTFGGLARFDGTSFSLIERTDSAGRHADRIREAQINLFRIVQEAVNNVVRHSGAARADVHVRRAGAALAITIRDDGRGFHVAHDSAGHLAGGFGLSGIAERARILDGRLEVASAPGEGTRIDLWVPVAPREAAAPGANDR